MGLYKYIKRPFIMSLYKYIIVHVDDLYNYIKTLHIMGLYKICKMANY